MTNATIEQELTGLLNKLTTEIEADQKQIDVLKKRVASNQQLKHALQARIGASSSADASAYGSKWENIRQAVKAITKTRFTAADIETELIRMIPGIQINRERIRSALWTLQSKKDTIKQVRKGDNRFPAEFEKIPNQSNGDK